jgi:hypothetical protein
MPHPPARRREVWRARRAFVKALGPGALAFPFLRALPARAAGLPGPRRFVVMQVSNGTVRAEYLPEGTETDFRFKRILAPLEPWKSKLVVLDGLDMKSFSIGPRAAHGGLLHQLVGRSALDPVGLGKRTDYTAGGPSLDQVVAAKIQGDAPVRSLELGVRCRGAGNYQTCSYRAPHQPNPVVDNPYQVWDRLFASLESPDRDKREKIRGSVVDFVHKEIAGLRGRLGAAERRQLDADLTSLRQIEGGFRSLRAPGAACRPPSPGAAVNHAAVANVPVVGKLMMDILVAALQCDLARVATFSWYDTNGGDEVLTFLNMTRTHHDLAHTSDVPGNPVGEALVTINRWYSEQFAAFLKAMDAASDGSGTLLDGSVVLFCNSLGNGKSHRAENVPYILAGSAGGQIRTGRFLRYRARAHNDLLTSIAHAFGLPIERFGDPQLGTGPLSELR